MEKLIIIDGNHLSLRQILDVIFFKNIRITIAPEAQEKTNKSRACVDKLINNGSVIYGLNTGFGSFKDTVVDKAKIEILQANLIKSHAIGTGPPFSEAETRAAILIRANSLIKGYSGIRLSSVEKLLELLHHNIYPYVPQQGSVGSSGDLAPLSHLILVLMGEGEVIEMGKRVPTSEIIKKYNFKPIQLSYKEGLAFNNGTSFMTAVAALNIIRARNIIYWADTSLAMSLEALRGTLDAFDEKIHSIRPHPGQMNTAQVINQLCQGSELTGPGNNYKNIQDSYSLRCASQVHGSVKDVLEYAQKVIEIEINATTDNPLIFADEHKVLYAGNFDGQPVALAMDSLSIALSELSTIAERRIAKLVDPSTNSGLPAFLTPPENAGLNSGYMITQYTAAALVAENKVLAHPVSNDSIPTSANQEDHVSFGTIAARKCRDIITNTEKVIAIELMCAAQGLDFRKPLKPGKGVGRVYDQIRQEVPFFNTDRILYYDLEKIKKLITRYNFFHDNLSLIRSVVKTQILSPRFHIKALTKGSFHDSFKEDVLHGLSSFTKKLHYKYLYDDVGSKLFDKICELPEYYPTRTEYAILQTYLSYIINTVKQEVVLIELGSGSSTKTRLLIEALLKKQKSLQYVPIDISEKPLIDSSKYLLNSFPSLSITGYLADYDTALRVLAKEEMPAKLIIFLGSSLGNLDPHEAIVMLSKIKDIMAVGDILLLGLDTEKEAYILEQAYNDNQGITAAFNLNILAHINKKLNANFNLDRFQHKAMYNKELHRIELRLESLIKQHVDIAALNREFSFEKGETIHVENSYKFSLERINDLVEASGLKLIKILFDNNRLFSLSLITV